MTTLKITNLSLSSFVKLSAFIGSAFGLVFGVFTFLASLVGGHVTARLIVVELKGVAAGIVNIFLFPILLGILCAFLAPLAYLPARFILRRIRGISLWLEVE